MEEKRPDKDDLLAEARSAFLTDPGYATAVAQKAVETKTRKERSRLVDNGER